VSVQLIDNQQIQHDRQNHKQEAEIANQRMRLQLLKEKLDELHKEADVEAQVIPTSSIFIISLIYEISINRSINILTCSQKLTGELANLVCRT